MRKILAEQAIELPLALSSMDAPCIASGSDELGRNVGLAVDEDTLGTR